jgi:hypothetical protein
MKQLKSFGHDRGDQGDCQIEQVPGFVGLLINVGLKTGLWEKMEEQGPITVKELALRTHSDPEILKQLLTILKHHELIFYDIQTDQYTLPKERTGFCFAGNNVYIVKAL